MAGSVGDTLHPTIENGMNQSFSVKWLAKPSGVYILIIFDYKEAEERSGKQIGWITSHLEKTVLLKMEAVFRTSGVRSG